MGIFYCTLVRLCAQSGFIHARHSFTAESCKHSWWNFTNYGLCINVSKTETVILNHILIPWSYNQSPQCTASELYWVYLGSYISQNEPNTGDIEINPVSKLHTQNLLPWPTSFKTPRFTFRPESRFWIVLSSADSRTHASIGI